MQIITKLPEPTIDIKCPCGCEFTSEYDDLSNYKALFDGVTTHCPRCKEKIVFRNRDHMENAISEHREYN